MTILDIFSGDHSINGKFAGIVKKYSNTLDKEADVWKISFENDESQVLNLFSSYIECIYTAAAIGLKNGHRYSEQEDGATNSGVKANILSSAWRNWQNNFVELYRLMVLVDSSLNLSHEERLKKICGDFTEDQVDCEFKYFMSFAYGGLLDLEKELSEIHDCSGLANFVSRAFSEIDDEED